MSESRYQTMAQKEERAVALLRKGISAVQVAQDRRIQVHPTTVQRWAHKHGIVLEFPFNRHQGRKDLVDVGEILRLRRRSVNGKFLFTIPEIAKLCQCSPSYVKQVCTKARKEGKL